MKKIALIGNMNNNFFALGRYLKDKGYEVKIFFRNTADHFHPKADTFNLIDLEICKEVNWFDYKYRIDVISQIKKELHRYDYYFGMGDEAAFAKLAGFNFDIYFPYGSDFYKYAHLAHKYSSGQVFLNTLFRKVPLKELLLGTNSKYIYDAIKSAKYLILDKTNPEYEQKLFDIKPIGQIIYSPFPFLYLKDYIQRKIWDVHWKSNIDRIRSENEFLVLYHGRHEWKNSLNYKNNKFTTKNTHHLIIAFANFIKNNPGINSKLITIEYGGDVENSKKLIKELGIENNVLWFPKMYRKDIMYLIKKVDLCCGEFDKSYLTFGTIIEAMAMGKPIIHYRDDKIYQNYYSELYPLYNARGPEEIEHQINIAYKDPIKRENIGKLSQLWVQKYFIEKPLNIIVDLINNS